MVHSPYQERDYAVFTDYTNPENYTPEELRERADLWLGQTIGAVFQMPAYENIPYAVQCDVAREALQGFNDVMSATPFDGERFNDYDEYVANYVLNTARL